MSWRFNKYIWLLVVETVIIVGLLVILSWRTGIGAPRSIVLQAPLHSATSSPRMTQTMLFVGDIMLARDIGSIIAREQDPLYPFLLTASTTRDADLAFANLESPLSTRGSKQGSEFSFRAEPIGAVNGLTYAGFDVVNLANNHVWDYGREAVLDTMDYLRSAGIAYVGFGHNFDEANEPVIKMLGETKIALVGYTEFYSQALWADDRLGLSSFDVDRITAHIQEIKRSGKADLVVVSFHWGQEYQTQASEQQRTLARAVIDAGADLVVGHHPHVVQEVEQYKGAWIAYSLGNFIFDQNFSVETEHGLMLKVFLRDKKIEEVEPIEVEFTNTYQPYIP